MMRSPLPASAATRGGVGAHRIAHEEPPTDFPISELVLTALVLAACGDDGNTTVTVGGTDSSNVRHDSTNDPSNTTPGTSRDDAKNKRSDGGRQRQHDESTHGHGLGEHGDGDDGDGDGHRSGHQHGGPGVRRHHAEGQGGV